MSSEKRKEDELPTFLGDYYNGSTLRLISWRHIFVCEQSKFEVSIICTRGSICWKTHSKQTYQVISCNWFPFRVAGHHHFPQSCSHIFKTSCQRQNGHDFTGDSDVKLALKSTITSCVETFQWKEKIFFSRSKIENGCLRANDTSLVWFFSVGDCPTVIFLRNLSLVSTTKIEGETELCFGETVSYCFHFHSFFFLSVLLPLCQVIVPGSMSSLTNLLISSSVRSAGSVLSIPSL